MAIIQNSELREELGSGVPMETLKKCVEEHQKLVARYNNLDNYYRGQHEILNRTMTQGLPNNKLVCNYAKFISDMATGYLIGKPVAYASEELDLTELLATFAKNDSSYVDAEIAKDCSVFGIGHELLYTDEEGAVRITPLDPREIFLVVDDTVEHKPLFGVHYFLRVGEKKQYSLTVYTDTGIYAYLTEDLKEFIPLEQGQHFFGQVPINEYKNNEEMQGDFEQVITLIDAYNKLASDRINAKEQDIDSILVMYGMENPTEEFIQSLREDKIMILPADSKAEWLLKNLSEEGNEVARNAVKEDIHKFSFVPDLTDENFAGNSSGVAMKYKVIAFEQMTAIKERYLKRGLRRRLQLIMSILGVKAAQDFDVSDIDISFTRNLPVNEVEIADMVANLEDMVSLRTLLGLLPFVEDPEKEMELVIQEREEKAKLQKEFFDDDGLEEQKEESEEDDAA